jgi:hypothetical protein
MLKSQLYKFHDDDDYDEDKSPSFLLPSFIKADSHIAYRVHAVPMPFPCHAVPLSV